MLPMVDSTDRRPKDYFHFGLTFFGIIFTIGGVITSNVAASVGGLVLVGLGMAYFLVEGRAKDTK